MTYHEAVKWHLRKPPLFSYHQQETQETALTYIRLSPWRAVSHSDFWNSASCQIAQKLLTMAAQQASEGTSARKAPSLLWGPTLNLFFLSCPILGIGIKNRKGLYFVVWSSWGVWVCGCVCVCLCAYLYLLYKYVQYHVTIHLYIYKHIYHRYK